MAQNPVFQIEFEETVADFAIGPVGPDPTPLCRLNEGVPATAPRVIIRNNQAWNVNFRWRASGTTTNLLVGDWTLQVHLVRLDTGGAPLLAGSKLVAHVPTDPHNFNETIPVAAGAIPNGQYKLYVSVDIGVPGPALARIAGFGEGPMMKFYTPH